MYEMAADRALSTQDCQPTKCDIKQMNQEDSTNQLEEPCGCFGLVEKGIEKGGDGKYVAGRIQILVVNFGRELTLSNLPKTWLISLLPSVFLFNSAWQSSYLHFS